MNAEMTQLHQTNNSHSMDPYALLNRFGPQKTARLTEQKDKDQLTLSEFKMNSYQINQELNKMATNFQIDDLS